jgi:hypothetical protein
MTCLPAEAPGRPAPPGGVELVLPQRTHDVGGTETR